MITRKGQIVNYVTVPKDDKEEPKLRKALVIEPLGENSARLDLGDDDAAKKSPEFRYNGKHTADAEYSENHKAPNTFHLAGENGAAVLKPAQANRT